MENTKRLINSLIENNIIKSEIVKHTMLKIVRDDFLPNEFKSYSYIDTPYQIGYNVTISAPHMHAYALELLKDNLKTSKKCLDVGSGSG